MHHQRSGTISHEELASDARWVLSDDDHRRSMRSNSGPSHDWERTFYPELASYIETADWSGVAELLMRTREQNLAELGIPPELVADVVVPEPEVP